MEPDKKPCEWCGTLFFPRRSDSRFCWPGSKCRTAAYRARLMAAAATTSGRVDRLRSALARLNKELTSP
jgi:hypothetical protein